MRQLIHENVFRAYAIRPYTGYLRIRYLFVELCVRCDGMFLIYDFKTHEDGIVLLDGAETVE